MAKSEKSPPKEGKLMVLMVYLVAFAGLGYQSSLISIEYFQYPTITQFEVMDYFPVMPTPKIVVSLQIPNVKTGMKVQDVFSLVGNSTVLTYARVKESAYIYSESKLYNRTGSNTTLESADLMDIKKAIHMDRFLFSMSSKRNIRYSPSVTFVDGMPIYVLEIGTNLSWNTSLYHSDTDRPQVYMASVESDIEGTKSKVPLTIPCRRKEPTCNANLMYSVKQTKLAPPPFDTNCRDYKKDGYTSRDNCYSKCLNSFTQKRGAIVESNVIDYDSYGKSSLILLPWHLRYTNVYKKVTNGLQGSKIDDIAFKDHVKYCDDSCHRLDCNVEVIIAENKPNYGNGRPAKMATLPGLKKHIRLIFYAPEKPVIVVTSQSKMSLTDFVVYITSSMSTWFGFCPLQAGQLRIQSRYRKIKKMMKNVLWSNEIDYNRPLTIDERYGRKDREKEKEKERKITMSRSISKSLGKLFVIFMVSVGFCLQSHHISDHYFRYPTSTYVSIATALPTTMPPKAYFEFCTPSRVGESIGNVFKKYLDTTKVFPQGYNYSKPNKPTIPYGTSCKRAQCYNFDVEPFIKMGSYYIQIGPHDPKPLDLQVPSDEPMYEVHFKSNILDMQSDKCGRHVKVYLSAHESDMEGIQRGTVWCATCSHKMGGLYLTYSVKITKLQPPPFDTNCREYRNSPVTSAENCFSQCITKFTSQYGLIIESNVMYRKMFENSSLELVPMSLRYDKSSTLSLDTMLDHHSRIESWRKPYINFTGGLRDKLSRMLPLFKAEWQKCRKSCRRSCYVESLTPKALVEWGTSPFKSWINGTNKTKSEMRVELSVFPPDDIVITVESQRRIDLLDYVIYIASCLGFWFGICPFPLVNQGVGSFLRFIKITRNLDKKTTKKLQTSWSILILRMSLYFVIIAGCCYQEQKIMQEYLQYPTTTLVTMETSLQETLPPRIVMPVHHYKTYNQTFSFVGWKVKDVFKYVNDETRVLDSYVKDTRSSGIDAISVKRFLTQDVYAVSFQPKKLIKYSPESMYAKKEILFKVSMQSNLPMKYWDSSLPLIMKSVHTDDEDVSSIRYIAFAGKRESRVHLSYSSKINKLAPYPYDTNCRNYQQIGATSKQNCFSECLNNYWKGKGLVLQTTYLDEEVYKNSSLIIIPQFMKYLKDNSKAVDKNYLLDEISKVNEYKKMKANVSTEFFERLHRLLPFYRHHWIKCNRSCQSDDCYFESVYPHVLYWYFDDKDKHSRVNNITIFIYPSNDQVITVTSTPKLTLLDFFVFSLSVISFWFGISPLDTIDWWKFCCEKIRRKRGDKDSFTKRKSQRRRRKPFQPQITILE